MLYMETNSLDPTWNLALEEAAQEWDQNEEIMMLWQNDNAIIVGRYQNAEKEINFDAANRLGVKVVRRSTGGGTVYMTSATSITRSSGRWITQRNWK
jgi:lipoate-protein ligase A